MNDSKSVVSIVGCAAGGLELIRTKLVEPLQSDGHAVTVTLTPAGARWLEDAGETGRIAAATGYPVRSSPRLPDEISPHPPTTVQVVAPATANTVAKVALGIADNQALTQINEGLTVVPTVIFPRVNAAHARHPAWTSHLESLRRAGVHLVYGDDVWPLHEPRSAPGRALPWDAILATVGAVLAGL